MNVVPPSATRFDGIATAYARYRPSYPAGAIATILDGLPEPADVVDVGAGTGIATQLFATAGARAIALEPSADMRAVALAAGLDARAGRADDTGLPDRSADLVTAFQAFHWFANLTSLAEFRRILRPGGRFAAAWNERDPLDEFSAELKALDSEHGETQMTASFELPDDGIAPLLNRGGFENVRELTFANVQRLNREGIVGRLRSLSFAPRSGAALEMYVAETVALFARFCDAEEFVTLRLRTDVTIGEVEP